MMPKKKKAKREKLLNSTWPQHSDCLGVHTSQIPEAREHYRKMGVPVDFCPKTGAAILTSAKHRKKVCEVSDMYTVRGADTKWEQGNAADSDPVRLTNRERENKGYTDLNRLQFIGNQQRFSERYTLIDWNA
jgi:hypothetical protein